MHSNGVDANCNNRAHNFTMTLSTGELQQIFSNVANADNTDDFRGLGNAFEALEHSEDGYYIIPKNGEGWHDVGKIGPKCFGSSCKPIGTDHGPSLTDGECWGSYAIYVSEDAISFQCQGRTLEASMAPRMM